MRRRLGYADGGRTYSGLSDDQLQHYGETGPEHEFFTGSLPDPPPIKWTPTPTIPTGPSTQGAGVLGDVISGLGAISKLGKLTSGAGSALQGAGFDNAFTQGMVHYGNEAANPLGTAANWIKGLGGGADYGAIGGSAPLGDAAALGSIGAGTATAGGLFGTSGAAALGASAPTAGLGSLATATPGALFGTSGSAAAGAGAGSLGGAGLAGATDAALGGTGAAGAGAGAGAAGAEAAGTGAAGSGGLGALGTAGLGAAYAAAAIAAGELIHKAFNAHGSVDRNRAAFSQVMQDWGSPEQIARVGAKGMIPINVYNIPGIGPTFMTQTDLDELSGNWYGAVYHPDGDQEGWQNKLTSTLERLKSKNAANAENLQAYRDKTGGAWNEDIWNKYVTGHAHGGTIGWPVHEANAEFARGGSPFSPLSAGLSDVPRYVQGGPGGGRGDLIDAKLSPKEYVMDAETVALAGDGDPDEGARKLDDFRRRLRMHKGKNLARGKFSANAKPLHSYFKGSK